MTEAEAKEAISSRWVTAWGSTTPIALGNEAAVPPPGAGAFAALWFGPVVEKQLTMGPPPNRRFEYRATVVVRLFGPVDAGENQLATLAANVRSALASQTIAAASGDITAWSAPSVTAKIGGWWTNTVTVPFRFYDRH